MDKEAAIYTSGEPIGLNSEAPGPHGMYMFIEACLKRMDGCFENRIASRDDVSAGQMDCDIGSDTSPDELATVGETVVPGTDVRHTAAGRFEDERLAAATSGGFSDGLATTRLSEDDGHVLASRERTRTGEHHDGAGEATRRVRLQGAKNMESYRVVGAAAILARVKNERAGSADRGPVLVPLLRSSIVSKPFKATWAMLPGRTF